MEEYKIKEIEIKFDKVLNAGFISRLFKWLEIKKNLSEIKIDFTELGREVSKLQVNNSNLLKNLDKLQIKFDLNEVKNNNINEILNQIKVERDSLQNKNERLIEDRNKLNSKLSSLETTNNALKIEVDKKLQKYENLSDKYDKKLENIQEEEKKKIEKYHKELKNSWSQHEDRVKGALKAIAERLGITYIPTNKFEFQGNPDNALLIADEYVIFDAKSPGNPDDLGNFPTYLKQQSERVKKYAKHLGVKKDVYLVVPENTLKVLSQFYYEEVDYRVHIITIQSLESVLRSLFKIEEYKTITDLNPEDRENLCRIIGKLLHVSKRRIQVDAFFGTVLHEILKDSEEVIPDEMQERINEYEASDKYNPKLENKSKTIPITDVKDSVKEMQTVAFGQEININHEELKKIELIPLKKKKN